MEPYEVIIDKPFKLEIFYEGHRYRVVVTHDDGRQLERVVRASWEPRFGIDVSDKNDIIVAAEEMCAELEK